MIKVVFLSPSGGNQVVEVLSGLTIMEAAVQNDIEGIGGDCGGSCNCGTCHVLVDDEWLPKLVPPDSNEAAMVEGLEGSQLPNSRLCCQIKVTQDLDGMVVRVPRKEN